MNATLIKYVLTAARRDRFFLSVCAIMIVGSALSIFLSSAAVVEQGQFSIVYLASSLRILGLLGLILFVVFFIRRSFEARDVEYLLTRPVSRLSFILSHSAGFSILSLIIALALGVALSFISYGMGNLSGGLYWSAGLVCEYLLIVNVALFFSMVLSSPVAASLSSFGFYVLARLMGQLLYIAQHPTLEIPGSKILSGVFQVISTIIPRLDLMTQTGWLVYGVTEFKDIIFIAIQAVFFLLLVLIATLIDLRRRQF